MSKNKVKTKVEHTDEVVDVKVTHEPDGPWHALVKVSDDGQRRKNLNFVEDTADDLRNQLGAVSSALVTAVNKVTELEQAQATTDEELPFPS